MMNHPVPATLQPLNVKLDEGSQELAAKFLQLAQIKNPF